MRTYKKGFTLIELLVVISIIGLLSSVVLSSLTSARAKARDSSRIASLVQVRNALEIYRTDFGTYPITSAAHDNFSNCGDWDITAVGRSNWIPGLTTKYLGKLPSDPLPQGPYNNCYVYMSDGTDYKVYYALSMEKISCSPITMNSLCEPTQPPSYYTISVYTPGAKNWGLSSN
jgi:type II secretion system protein G